MGVFDLAAPLLAAVDQALSHIFPAGLRLALWGVLSGWLTMLLYRRLSRQDAIAALKAEQRKQQEEIARFEGEFGELMPMVRKAFALGFRQLGLSLGPALLATLPILFIVAWVATTFVYSAPEAGESVNVTTDPGPAQLSWSENAQSNVSEDGWTIRWPAGGEVLVLSQAGEPILELSSDNLTGVIHKRRWWNLLFGNPAGYLAPDQPTEIVRIDLPQSRYLPLGPVWMRGWMFVFFGAFLVASVAFKFILKIE